MFDELASNKNYKETLNDMSQVDDLLREELREQKIPAAITLTGEPALIQIATQLLAKHPNYALTGNGKQVSVLSREAFCVQILASFLNGDLPPSPPLLLYSISEEQLSSYANLHGLPMPERTAGDIKMLLDNLATKQPQTYSSLMRSGQRLILPMQVLRETEGKNLK